MGMVCLSLSMLVLLDSTLIAGAALSEATAIPSQCPHSGVLRLKAGEYNANVSLANCTIIGEAPGVVVHGKISFDHGLLMGIIHFEGAGATSSCVEGSVEVRGDDMRFHGCDIHAKGNHWAPSNVTVSGGRARFEHGRSLCALTVVAGSVDVINVTGCDGDGYLRVGPGPVNLTMTDVGRYRGFDIDGMKGRLGGKIQTETTLVIKNSIVEFDNFGPRGNSGGGSLFLDNVIGTGSLDLVTYDHNSFGISNCQFHDMAYSAYSQRGGVSISNTTWKGGSCNVGWGGYMGLGLTIHTSDFQNVAVSGHIPGPTQITSSNVTGKIGLRTDCGLPMRALGRTLDYPCGLTIAKSRVVFLPASSSSVHGPIRISSSALSFPESSGALLGSSNLEVNKSNIHVTNLRNGSAVHILGDIHMYESNLDITNCSVPGVSQSSTKANPIIV